MKPVTFRNTLWLIILILVAMSTLTSCDPMKRATRKHARIVKRFPHVHQQDTVVIHDTVRITVPKTQVDTVLLASTLVDTVEIIKDRLKIRMYTVHDSIYVDGECDTVTVEKIIERKIPIRYYNADADKWKCWNWVLIVLGVILLYFVFKKLTTKTQDRI